MLFSIAPFLAALVAVVSVSAADMYYLDDTDPSITYVGSSWVPLRSNYAPITWANASECYNGTFTVGQGYGFQNHGMEIPFHGTGITLFVAYNNRLGLNVSITLDNNFTTINWFILDTDFTTPLVVTYNATLYDKQALYDGDHHLTLVIEDYMGDVSDIMFDFAAVTGIRPALSSPSKTGSKVGAGVGGALGALALIAALVLIFLSIARRRQTRSKTSNVPLELDDVDADADAKDPNIFNRVTSAANAKFRPTHGRHTSSFSEPKSPISPLKASWNKFSAGDRKHPWEQIQS